MSEVQRTLTFVGVAAASLVVALFAAPSGPKAPKEFDLVGQEFFPEFTDPDAAKQLQVIAYNSDTAEARVFGVEFKDGLWRIPSRHNYPADGKDRLAKCAASLIGLKREAVAGYRESEQPEFEVVDPFDEKSDSLKRGQRITLKDAGGKPLADFIVGKQVPNRSGFYYVRRPDEKVTYTAKISLDLSTKFADWIEPDLLKVDSSKLTGIEIDNYSIDTNRGEINKQDQSKLTRKTSSEPWKLDDLKEDEEVNQDEVRKLVDGLDNLKIVGVRPKPARLQRDLRLAEGIKLDQATMIDLGMKGFLFARSERGGQQMYSKEGDVIARTDQGVQYELHFGDIFTGTEEEIEFGFTKTDEQPAEGEKKPEEGTKADDKKASGLKKSRYLFVTVAFNPEALGEKPTEPVKPEAPEEPTDAPKPPAREESSPADATVAENVGAWAEYNAAKSAYDLAVAGFESAKAKYEADTKAYEDKVKEGEKKVKELNNRFADWYYVISGDSFENLRQGRKTLVKPKSQTPGDQGAGGPTNPLNFNLPK